MSDPYNSTGRQYDVEVFCKVLSEAHSRMVRPMWDIIRRWESQHMEAGYDPYNNQRLRYRVEVMLDSRPHPSHNATRKP